MSELSLYLPQDRVRALAMSASLPDRTSGSVIFADISGFTPLTDALRTALGARRGAEVLNVHLDAVYTALIAEVERFGGSVIGFAGDSITCWFDEAQGAPVQRGAACAFALQTAMLAFSAIALPDGTTTALKLKVSLASGSARRFVVGDPGVYYVDTLAGATVARSAKGERLAQKGEVIADQASVDAADGLLNIREWRVDPEGGERFALVEAGESAPLAWEWQPRLACRDESIYDWVPKHLLDREHAFLNEFRPCAAVFVRFIGIDYDSDAAQDQLDQTVRLMQSLCARYDAAFVKITIGDKGSYAHLNLGALSKHEDDARRAVKLALELRTAARALGFLAPLQIGVTMGTMRVGTYGGSTRRAFDPLGNEVNLSARLMQTAQPGSILVSGHVYKATHDLFIFEPHAPLIVKGKPEPIPVFTVKEERQRRAMRLQEPTYALPMVGRQVELQRMTEKLDLTLSGQGQLIGVVAEAGVGKSRLIAELVRVARKKGFSGYGGACQSDSVNTPYQVWKTVWQAFFDLDPAAPPRQQMRMLEAELERRAPDRLEAMPLLNPLLNLSLPDNDFTRPLEPKFRQSVLHALLEDCLRAASQEEPLLIVIEDLHWIDALSLDLLETLSRALIDAPVCFILAYRPPEPTGSAAGRIEGLSNFSKIALGELSAAEAEQAIRAKLAQLYPSSTRALPPELVAQLMKRAQGNPFYLEELLNYLHDRGLDPREPHALDQIELPDSLHALILSRIDQLTEPEKMTLRAASIIGRLFNAAWLTGYYPALGDINAVKPRLDQLHALDITPLESPEPELAYLFKHIVTHEVTYESLPFVTRSRLHEQLARYIESQVALGTLHESAVLDTLVYHYNHTDNHDKQRHYLGRAAAAALAVNAYAAALDHLTHLFALTSADDPERSVLARQMGEAHYRLGDYAAAQTAVEQAQTLALNDSDRAAALTLRAEIVTQKGDYAASRSILAEVVPLARQNCDTLTHCRALYALGAVHYRTGDHPAAREAFASSLALAQDIENINRELIALNGLGTSYLSSDLDQAERLFTQVYERAQAAHIRERMMIALNNLGVVADKRANDAAGRAYHQQTLEIAHELGAQYNIAHALSNLAGSEIALGDLEAARLHTHEAIVRARRLGSGYVMIQAMCNVVELAYADGQPERALAVAGLMRRQPAWSSEDDEWLAELLALWKLDPALVEAGLAQGDSLDWESTLQAFLKSGIS